MAVRHATAVRDIDGDGVGDTLVPAVIVSVHGGTESGGGSEAAARRYQANLTQLMNLMRAALRVDELLVVVAEVGEQAFVEGDGNAAQVRLRACRSNLRDPLRRRLVELGRRLAIAMAELEG